MDVFPFLMPSRTFFQNDILIKNYRLPDLTSKEAGQTFVANIKKKMLAMLQDMRLPYLEMHNPSTRNLTKMDIVDN